MIDFDIKDYLVKKSISLDKIPTSIEKSPSKKEYYVELDKIGLELSSIQDKMYAHNKYSVLICLQGMDTAGKDSLVREVFKAFNPRGIVVHSFKTPNTREIQHDYLWRHYKALPEKGKFAVFNRSHYENVLITRVNPHFLLRENLPGINSVADVTDTFWENRFRQIINFEEHLAQNGVIVMKFFLHMSKDEQKRRILRRLDKKKHNWKFTPADVTERALWDTYQEHYEKAINKTSLPHAPWFVVPADSKPLARFITARIILEVMSGYKDIKEPTLAPEIEQNIASYREQLLADG